MTRIEYRHEVKIVVDAFDAIGLDAELRLHPTGLRVLHPPRVVQSIYFDSHDRRALRDNLAGISAREKVRFRWYGPASTGVEGRLERKVRRNALGTKITYRLAHPIDVEGVSRAAFTDAVRAGVSSDARDSLDGLHPAQWVRYRREYFTTFDRRVRVTVDRHIETMDVTEGCVLRSARVSPKRGVVVVEAKAGSDDTDAVRDFVAALPYSVTKSSKYVLASAPEHY